MKIATSTIQRLILAACMSTLTGCAGLSVNMDLAATYRSNIQPGTYGVDAKTGK